MTPETIPSASALFDQVRQMIDSSRHKVMVAVNTEIVLLYWNVGKYLNDRLLGNARAAYGKQVVSELSQHLVMQYGKGWSEKHLWHCLRSAETFSEDQILSAVRRQLNWTQLKTIQYLKTDLQRAFYLEMSANERWSSRQLQDRINSMLFERTSLSKLPEETIKGDLEALRTTQEMSIPLAFKDPYILDFLGLADTYSEKDIEQAILHQLQLFILELGNDFAFLARQKRITVGDTDYYLDLLFYHRKLRRLIAIDLKLGKFEAEHKGQMELYLRWLAKYEQHPNELPPIGIILCADKDEELVQLLEMDQNGIHVAEYLTELPSIEVLQSKLKLAIEMSRRRLEG
ncbi:MAG: PDDEXK nuclease domain-containing protein [Bacteroidia bacterium]